MRKLFPILMVVFVVAAVVVFSSQTQAGGWRRGGGHGWNRGWSGGHAWAGGHGWNRGVGRWYPRRGGWYPGVAPGAIIVDDWADCEIVKRCFIDRYGCRRCRWVKVCPW